MLNLANDFTEIELICIRYLVGKSITHLTLIIYIIIFLDLGSRESAEKERVHGLPGEKDASSKVPFIYYVSTFIAQNLI